MTEFRPVIRIAPNNQVFDLPVIVGIEEGLFEAAGLDVKFSATHADREKDAVGGAIMSRLKENLFDCGSADSYNVCEWASIDRLERGNRGGNIAALRAAVAAQAILSFDEALQVPRDLADVPVVVQELTGSHYCTLQMLESAVGADHVNIFHGGLPQMRWAGLKNGSYRAVTVMEPFISLGLKEGAHIIAASFYRGGEVIAADLTPEQRKAYYDAENRAVDLINGEGTDNPNTVRTVGACSTHTPEIPVVVINSPAYPPFFSVITAAGRRVVESPLHRGEDGTYRLDLEALDRVLAPDDVTVYALCNPHNPTGNVFSPDELAAVVEIARRRRVQLLSDEIHAPLVYAGRRHTPVATMAPETIVFSSASKAWNLPGLKAALVAAGGDPAWEKLSRLPVEVTFGVGLPGVLAGEAAFEHGEEWLAALMRGLDDNRRLLAELLPAKLPGVGYVPPDAMYLAWLDLRPLHLGDSPGEVLLERARVALSDGPGFGDAGRGFARLNFATSPAILAEAIDRIASVV